MKGIAPYFCIFVRAPAITHTKHLQTATRIIRVRLRLWELIVTQKTIQEKWYEDMEGWYIFGMMQHPDSPDVDWYGIAKVCQHVYLLCYVFGHLGVSENSVPLNPMVLLIIIPIKWLFHWEYTQHFQVQTHLEGMLSSRQVNSLNSFVFRFVARWAHVHYTGPEAYEVRSRAEKAHIFKQSPQPIGSM